MPGARASQQLDTNRRLRVLATERDHGGAEKVEVVLHHVRQIFGGTPATPDGRVLQMYAGTMMDPSLRPRLSASAVPPTLVVWGEDDGVVDHEYGRAYARAISGAEFRLLRGVGHSPQVEVPVVLAETVWPFVAKHAPIRRP